MVMNMIETQTQKPYLSFVKAMLIRALRTFAQVVVSLIPAGVTIEAVDWRVVLGTAALAAVASILTSLATGLPEADDSLFGGEDV